MNTLFFKSQEAITILVIKLLDNACMIKRNEKKKKKKERHGYIIVNVLQLCRHYYCITAIICTVVAILFYIIIHTM